MELHTRQIVHTAVTRSPTDDWTAQQLREATPWGNGPNYLIRDRDNKYAPLFLSVAKGTGIKVLKTPVRAPKANAICECFIGGLKRECLQARVEAVRERQRFGAGSGWLSKADALANPRAGPAEVRDHCRLEMSLFRQAR
jgi:hypothetical protein